MSRRAKVIVFEGSEGCFKTTNVAALATYLMDKGCSVLVTKEPGTTHLPITQTLRGIMLDKQYDHQLTRQARELISQAIRSIHLEKLLIPAAQEYDYIIMDRGLMSGYAYALACGNDESDIDSLVRYIGLESFHELYDHILLLRGDPELGLKRAAAAKQEFAAGDAIEAKGASFMRQVEYNFDYLSARTDKVVIIDVLNKSRDEVLADIVRELKL